MILSAGTASLRWSALWTKRHMIIFDVLSWKSPVGEKGERLRLFLSDVGYAKAQASERRGEIKIRKHAAVIEGHILPDRKKRRH